MNQSSSKRTTSIKPTWCPGCGNYGILGAINQALDKLQIEPHQICFTYDVGCSSNMADFVFAYGFHGLHGRALPLAAGIKLANHQLPIIAIIGDGGCFGEGLTHFISLSRGNHDILVISHDNYLYSLTTGQMSPTTQKGTPTPSTPDGSLEEAFNPLATALINQATFVARGFAGDIPHLSSLIQAGINHTGFAFIDVLQPCVTYNPKMTYQWFRQNSYQLKDKNHNPNDFNQALTASLETNKFPLGLFYQVKKPAYHQQISHFPQEPLNKQDIQNINLKPLL